MCNCIKEVNEQIADRNTGIVATIPFNGKDSKVAILTMKNDSKQRGKAVNLIASYCPFCGKKYDTEALTATPPDTVGNAPAADAQEAV